MKITKGRLRQLIKEEMSSQSVLQLVDDIRTDLKTLFYTIKSAPFDDSKKQEILSKLTDLSAGTVSIKQNIISAGGSPKK